MYSYTQSVFKYLKLFVTILWLIGAQDAQSSASSSAAAQAAAPKQHSEYNRVATAPSANNSSRQPRLMETKTLAAQNAFYSAQKLANDYNTALDACMQTAGNDPLKKREAERLQRLVLRYNASALEAREQWALYYTGLTHVINHEEKLKRNILTSWRKQLQKRRQLQQSQQSCMPLTSSSASNILRPTAVYPASPAAATAQKSHAVLAHPAMSATPNTAQQKKNVDAIIARNGRAQFRFPAHIYVTLSAIARVSAQPNSDGRTRLPSLAPTGKK